METAGDHLDRSSHHTLEIEAHLIHHKSTGSLSARLRKVSHRVVRRGAGRGGGVTLPTTYLDV